MKPIRFLTSEIQREQDVVQARSRARQLAQVLGLESQDQTRVATAVSEIARNAFQYAKKSRIEFSVSQKPVPMMVITVTDEGPGIANLAEIQSGAYRST